MTAKEGSGMEIFCLEGVSTAPSMATFRTRIFSCLFAEKGNQTEEKQVSHSSLSGLQPCRPCVRRPCYHVAQPSLAQVIQERGTRGVLNPMAARFVESSKCLVKAWYMREVNGREAPRLETAAARRRPFLIGVSSTSSTRLLRCCG